MTWVAVIINVVVKLAHLVFYYPNWVSIAINMTQALRGEGKYP